MTHPWLFNTLSLFLQAANSPASYHPSLIARLQPTTPSALLQQNTCTWLLGPQECNGTTCGQGSHCSAFCHSKDPPLIGDLRRQLRGSLPLVYLQPPSKERATAFLNKQGQYSALPLLGMKRHPLCAEHNAEGRARVLGLSHAHSQLPFPRGQVLGLSGPLSYHPHPLPLHPTCPAGLGLLHLLPALPSDALPRDR